MMRVRRASVIVALFLLPSARTALAECAWVLWQFARGEWTTLATSHQRTECDRDRVRHYGLEQAPPPGIGTVIRGEDAKNFFMRVVLASITGALATEPEPVVVDVDLHWTVLVYGAISLSGSQEWQNGVGYTDTTKSPSGSGTGGPNDRWHITGVPSGFWVNFPALGPANAGQFVLDLESSQLHGIPHFSVTFDGQLIHPVLLPGDYAIG